MIEALKGVEIPNVLDVVALTDAGGGSEDIPF